ncbi:hypothetical protein BCF55_1661 [Hydrogenivirga caldilitoris]|uniref:Uncharacterized protein n=1 Tax=Hydrogenivirga caldilitoris TaxID=246264 RepID=A0A497XSX1_9AQUI|nr:hypothetical protein [Hydrogenivirga caldilitoris]RLJ71361.1 hypothetical protein BCF55_1661 [Hydrogenivirga caldilitoris]
MKVLIVSFDKTLTEDLKKALSEHEVYVAKNSEEAIKVMPSDIEGVVYDAISGAISEEDINTLYTKKFSNARYVILYDELFPVDEGNIIVPQKLLVPRDSSPKDIADKLLEFPVEEAASEVVEQPFEETAEVPEFEIEPTAYEAEETVEELAESMEEALQEFETGIEEVKEEVVESPPEKPKTETPVVGTGKILIVSFDQTLIDSIKAAFGRTHEVVNVKTVKQAIEEGKDASVVVFDAISGVIAEKGLIELANDENMSQKSYIILVDDLFPINVEGIPLERKVSISRDTDPAKIKELIEEQLETIPTTTAYQEEAQPEEFEEEIPSAEELEARIEESMEAVTEEPEFELQEEEAITEEEPMPALEALAGIIESEEAKVEEEQVEEEEIEEEVTQPVSSVSVSGKDLDRLVESAVIKALSEDRIREAVARALEERMLDIRDMVADVVRREVEKVFEELDIRNLIRQATYQALRERLEELIT